MYVLLSETFKQSLLLLVDPRETASKIQSCGYCDLATLHIYEPVILLLDLLAVWNYLFHFPSAILV